MNMSQILKRVEEEDNYKTMLDTQPHTDQLFDTKEKSI